MGELRRANILVKFVIYLPLAAVVGVRDIAKPIKHQLVIMTIIIVITII